MSACNYWATFAVAFLAGIALRLWIGWPMKLRFKPEFNWRKVAWGRPDSPRRELCAYCHGALPEVPLMLWTEDDSAASLCDACVERWVTSEVA